MERLGMVKVLLVVMALLILTGCPKPYHHELASMKIDASKSASVGDSFFRHEEVFGEKDANNVIWFTNTSAFELTVVGLTDSTLALQYKEYVKGTANTFHGDSPWLIRDAFNQRYDYPLVSKKIRFRTYEFEVLANDDGSLMYRRIH